MPGDAGERRQFGNLMFSRYSVIQYMRHLLPWPADPAVPSMQRIALEAVLAAPFAGCGCDHDTSEYYSKCSAATGEPPCASWMPRLAAHRGDPQPCSKEGGLFATMPRPASAILTADLHFRADDPLQCAHLFPLCRRHAWVHRDARQVRHGARPHDHTPFGVHDRKQWPEAFACDFIFVTEDLAGRVEDVKVNLDTDASDHQPVLLHLSDWKRDRRAVIASLCSARVGFARYLSPLGFAGVAATGLGPDPAQSGLVQSAWHGGYLLSLFAIGFRRLPLRRQAHLFLRPASPPAPAARLSPCSPTASLCAAAARLGRLCSGGSPTPPA